MTLSHDDLVERAASWLANSMHCPVVITELATGFEQPDAIGFTSRGHSVLVECKTSKSDFAKDQWKPGRMRNLGMGGARYYLVPPDLVEYVLENRPERWGVLVCHKRRVEIRAKAEHFSEVRRVSEISALVSCLRRLPEDIEGVNVKHYSIRNENSNPQATLGIERALND